MIVARKLVGLTFILLSLAACQQNTAKKSAPKTRPAIRAANGTLYDLKCLKGGKPGTMAGCAVDTSKSSVRKAYSDSSQQWYEVTEVSYFIWQMPYFDESSMCQWMWGMPACYSYFGTQAVPGPTCQVNWLFQYQDLPQNQARNCGNWWNPRYTPPSQGNWGGWPWWERWPQDPSEQPTLSCADIKAERDWQASQASYCNQDSQCEVHYTQTKWGSCNPAATNKWLHSEELDYWADEYESQCLRGATTPVCPMVVCSLPKCVSGRCSQTCP